MKISWFLPGVVWLIISTILLLLPGDDLPSTGFFGIENFDKIVHLGMFALLTFLFSLPFLKLYSTKSGLKKASISIALLIIIYGILIEYAQKYWASDRAFDLIDIIFDSIGSIIGLLIINSKIAYKKIGPDRNRGRNQN